MRAKYLGQLTTRLYIVLFIIGFAILTVYSVIRSRFETKTVIKPSFDMYNRLMHDHNDTLRCPCSFVSSIYNQYVKIEPKFHQICTSSFVSDEWQKNLTSSLSPDLSDYTQRDYRRFLSAHFKFLTGLCRLSIQSVNTTIYQFLSSLFVTSELLSQEDFYNSIHSSIEQSQVNTPRLFTRLLRLLRNTNHGNAIISAYGTNFEYVDSLHPQTISTMDTQAITYDNCSCYLNANCTVQALFIDKDNLTKSIPIMGLKIGCTPTESFIASTLSCFYNLSCINVIYQQLNYNDNNDIDRSLSINTSRFTPNTLIIDLVNDVFVENWSRTIDYPSYFDQCSPSLCSYTYSEQVNFFYTVTLLLGVYGGLSLLLKWLCPIIIRLLIKLNTWRKKRTNHIEPVVTIEIATNERTKVLMIEHSNPQNTVISSVIPMSITSNNTSSTPLRLLFYRIFPCIIIIAAIIIPSIYLIKQWKNHAVPNYIAISTTTTETTNISDNSNIVSTTPEPEYPLEFHPIVLYPARVKTSPSPLGVGDFNSDGRQDIAIVNRYDKNIGVLFGNEDGSFQEETKFWIETDNELSLIVVGHVNNDYHSDFVFTNGKNNIGIMLGNGDGTFQEPMMRSIEVDDFPTSVLMGDFNNDGATDLVITIDKENTIMYLYGNNDGTFETQIIISSGYCTNKNLVIGDLNKDDRLDLISVNENICVLLANANEDFESPMFIELEHRMDPTSAIVGDFNHDNQLDFVFTDFIWDNVVVLLGNSNGTFQAQKLFSTGLRAGPQSIVVGDFNNDGKQDFAVGLATVNIIAVLLGNGDGTFQIPIEFSTGSRSEPAFITMGKFNDDRQLDIVVKSEKHLTLGILLSVSDDSMFKTLNKNALV